MKIYDIDYPHIGVDPPLAGVSSFADLKLVDHIVGEVGNFYIEFNRRSLEVIGNETV